MITSRRFVELGRLEPLIAAIQEQAAILYIEDLKQQIGLFDRLLVLLTSFKRLHRKQQVKPQDPATLLFTSGSEGHPKGVVLSH